MVDRFSLTKALVRRQMSNLNAAAIPTKSEVFMVCGYEARDFHDALETLLTALEAAQARAEKAEASLVEAMGALQPFVRAFRTLDTRWDGETKINIFLPTTKRVKPVTYVYVEDAQRASDVHSRLLEGVSGEGGSARADLSRASSSPTPSPAGTPMPSDFVEEVRARLTMIADGEHLRGKTTHFLGEVRSMDHIVRVAARCFGRPTLRVGDREGHGTERPQASPQPRDAPLPPSGVRDETDTHD